MHVNAEFAAQASDHDPSVARLTFNDPPTVDAGGPYTVSAGFTVGGQRHRKRPDGDPLTYAWDLDDNGIFETPGQSATYSAESAMAPGTHTIRVRATDPGGLSAVDTTTVTITVTYDSLCALTQKLVTKNDVEEDLCQTLEEAEKAEAKGKTTEHDKKLDGVPRPARQADRQGGQRGRRGPAEVAVPATSDRTVGGRLAPVPHGRSA